MYNHAPADYLCPFCQILRGEETEHGNEQQNIVWREKNVSVLIGAKWIRSTPGHVIIIPNQHIENLYDLPEDTGHRIFDLSKEVVTAARQLFDCDGVTIAQRNEPAAGQDVWHYHLHVYPRYDGDTYEINQEDVYWPTAEEIKPYADKLRDYFANHQP